MKALRYRGAVLFAVAALIVASAAFANVFLLDFYGYDYFWPYTPPAWTPGNCYNALGYVPAVNATYLTFNYGTNEYTFFLHDVCYASQTPVGTHLIIDFTGGAFDVYEDALSGGSAADYGVSPPNATAPSTFTDGTNVLGGDFSGLQIVIDTTTGNADLYGTMNLVRGTQLGSIPVDQRSGWTLAGLRANAPEMPAGYWWQIDGQLYIEEGTPVERSTWGGLKKSFKGDN